VIIEDVQRHAVADGAWELSAQLRGSARIPDTRVWFRFSGIEPWAGPVGEPVDGSPFVVALLLAAMRAGEPLQVDAPVSRRLLDQVTRAQHFYRTWYRGRIDDVKVEAPAVDLGPGDSTTVCCFSGGIDAWYTLLHAPDGPPVTHTMTVDPLHNRYEGDERAGRLEAVARVVAERGLEPIVVDTNLVTALAPVVHQSRIFGPTLGAAGLALGRARLLIGTSKSIRALGMWNSHPMLDPLWSTERTEVVHHGIEANRIEKAAALAASDVAWTDVHVCLDEPQNCGRCEKCVRTMVELHLVGVDPEPVFGASLDPLTIATGPRPGSRRWFWDDIETELSRRREPLDQRLLLAVRVLLFRDDLAQQGRRVRKLASSARRVAQTR
jgi:hypothetical protein